ncbi:hypothetical protein CSC17_1636 [Klebsiella oxytoca]|nr:hypothetical protein CSC17_1636 [Klebsiella oxytoca]
MRRNIFTMNKCGTVLNFRPEKRHIQIITACNVPAAKVIR